MTSELLMRYSQSSIEFLELAKSLTKSELEAPSQDGEWSRAYILHHMADADVHFAARYWHVLTVEKPSLADFDEDLYPVNLFYANRNPLDSLAAIEGLFRMTFDALKYVGEAKWQRTGVHAVNGELTLSQILSYAVDHRESHLNQLRQFH